MEGAAAQMTILTQSPTINTTAIIQGDNKATT